jgi:hypothetical protein
VVLVGLAAHERVHAERVRADVEPDRGLQLLLARQREREQPVGLVVLDVVGGEVVADDRGGVGAGAHATDSRMKPRARS